MSKEKLLILAVTYPDYSEKKHYFTTCVAGINQNEELRRIYPIPLHHLLRLRNFFKKFQWIEYEIKEKGDARNESYKIYYNTIKHIKPALDGEIFNGLEKRINTIYELNELKNDHNISLGFIKPTIKDFEINFKRGRILKKNKLDSQRTLFNNSLGENYIAPLVSFNFCCCNSDKCKGHNIICEDIYFWNIFKSISRKNSNTSVLKSKIQDDITKDIGNLNEAYFMLGTHYIYGTWLILSIISKYMLRNLI